MGKIKHLEVNLDTNNACNMNCKYCFLGDKNNFHQPHFNKEYYDSLDLSKCEIIEFWGGEPFLYWEHFCTIAAYFRDRCPQAELYVLSNGSILNENIINFLIEKRIFLSLSHDGPDQYIRGDDFLKDTNKIELLKKLPYKIIFSMTLTSQHAPYSEYKDFFYKLSETGLNFTCKIIPARGTDDFNMPFAFTTIEHAENLIKFFSDMIDDCNKSLKSSIIFYYTLARLIGRSKSKYPCSTHESDFLATTTDGSKVVCHTGKKEMTKIAGCLDCPAAGQCYVSCQVLNEKFKVAQCDAAKLYAEKINEKVYSIWTIIDVPTYFVCLDDVKDIFDFVENYDKTKTTFYFSKSKRQKQRIAEIMEIALQLQKNDYVCLIM